MLRGGQDSSDSEQEPVAGYCELSNENRMLEISWSEELWGSDEEH
jgi:hypothetical protein